MSSEKAVLKKRIKELEKAFQRSQARNTKLEKDVKKYKKQSLTMREKINDLEYHIRDTQDSAILNDLRDLKRHCPTKSETMQEIEAEEGKVVIEPPENEPEFIEQTYFCINVGEVVTRIIKNPKAETKRFNIRKRFYEAN